MPSPHRNQSNQNKWSQKYPLPSEEVSSYYFSVPQSMLDQLIQIRTLIYELAEADERIGMIQECLKWGEPSFLTPITKSGSTIRLAKVDDSMFGIYFNCKTTIAQEIAIQFPELNCDGKRALNFSTNQKIPKTKLIVCLKKALLYHKRKFQIDKEI